MSVWLPDSDLGEDKSAEDESAVRIMGRGDNWNFEGKKLWDPIHMKNIVLKIVLRIVLRYYFDSVTCANFSILSIFLV